MCKNGFIRNEMNLSSFHSFTSSQIGGELKPMLFCSFFLPSSSLLGKVWKGASGFL